MGLALGQVARGIAGSSPLDPATTAAVSSGD
jgi:hypothetical protein